MRLKDIVNRLTGILPEYTNYFSEQAAISSLTVSGGLASIVLEENINIGLNSRLYIRNSQAKRNNAISAVEASGDDFKFTTAEDHDLTLNFQETVNLSGFTNEDWNNDFDLVGVPNRRSFIVSSSNTLPTLNGSETLNELLPLGVNSTYAATKTSAKTFTFDAADIPDGTYQGGSMHYGIRVSAVYDYAQAIDQYTRAKEKPDFWCFVAKLPQSASKDRSSLSDAQNIFDQESDIRQRILAGFQLFVFVKTTDQIQPLDAIDICGHELLPVFLKALLGLKFENPVISGTGNDSFCCVYVGDEAADYTDAYYTHEYTFQVPLDINASYAVEPDFTRAFRDIEYNDIKSTAENMTANIDLDEEPL